VLALLVAAALFSRYGIHGALARDEAVYAYGGQQLDDGVPFYASIFDQKTPGAAFLAGLGDALGGFDGIRIAFFVCACLTVVAVYLLALELWGRCSRHSSPPSSSRRSAGSRSTRSPARTRRPRRSCSRWCRCC
jgi:hypothetical protein